MLYETSLYDSKKKKDHHRLITELFELRDVRKPRFDCTWKFLQVLAGRSLPRSVLDSYNNNTRIHIDIVKPRIKHNCGSKVLSRRKQTNKKNKKTKRCLAWQLDEVRGAARYLIPRAASGDVRKNGRRYRRRSLTCLPGTQKVKSSSAESV